MLDCGVIPWCSSTNVKKEKKNHIIWGMSVLALITLNLICGPNMNLFDLFLITNSFESIRSTEHSTLKIYTVHTSKHI